MDWFLGEYSRLVNEKEATMTICNILTLRYSDCKKEIDQTSDPIEIQKLEDELKILEEIMKFKKCM
jgi:hypothetical protein